MVENKRKSRSGDAEPVLKRQRVSRACDQCRSAREKCDGIQPICFTCASNNRDCTYTTNPKRRGIQPGYIRTLELTLAWTFGNVAGAEDAIIALLQDEKGQALIASTDSAVSNKLHKKWRKHVVSSAIDRILSGESASDLFEHAMTTSGDEEEEDEESAPEPHANHQPFLTPDSLKTGPGNFSTDDFAVPQLPELQPQHSVVASLPDSTPGAEVIQLPQNFWRLNDVYFAYTHSWLPLVSKEQVLKLCYSYPSDGLQLPAAARAGDHAELWSIFALAAVQNQSTQAHAGLDVPRILQTAESLAYVILDDAQLGHVGALLNLALVSIALQRGRLAWTLLGRAIRMGLWLKMETKNQLPSTSQPQERLQGLLLGCFVVETILSAQIGLVPCLRADLARSFGSLSEEGLDEWQPWSTCEDFHTGKHGVRPTLPSQARSTFNQLVKLCYILNDRICERTLEHTESPAKASMSNWLSTLPPALGPLHSMSLEQTSPQKLHLFLAFLVGRTYDLDHRATIEEALSVLDHFTYALGLAAMPPLFACFLHILKGKADSDGFQQNRLAGMLTRFSTVWKEPGKNGDTVVMSPSSVMQSSPRQEVNTTNTTPRPLTSITSYTEPGAAVSPHDVSLQLQRSHSLQQPGPLVIPAQVQNVGMSGLPAQPSIPQYEDNMHLRSYSTSDQSMDLDALFDHFTAIDGTDQSGLNPQFMQNLGFAPNANLADLMASDYGWALDPG